MAYLEGALEACAEELRVAGENSAMDLVLPIAALDDSV